MATKEEKQKEMKKGECNRDPDAKGKGGGGAGNQARRGTEKKVFTGKKSAEITYSSKGDFDHPDRYFDMRRRHWMNARSGGRIPSDWDMQMRQRKRECEEYAEEFKKLQRSEAHEVEPKTKLKLGGRKEAEVSAKKRAKVVAPPSHIVIKAKNVSSTEMSGSKAKKETNDNMEVKETEPPTKKDIHINATGGHMEEDKKERESQNEEAEEKKEEEKGPAFAGFGGYESSSEEEEKKKEEKEDGSDSSSSS